MFDFFFDLFLIDDFPDIIHPLPPADPDHRASRPQRASNARLQRGRSRFCVSDGSDHRACCSDRGVPRRCLEWCRGEPVNNKMCVLSYSKSILACFHELRGKPPKPYFLPRPSANPSALENEIYLFCRSRVYVRQCTRRFFL